MHIIDRSIQKLISTLNTAACNSSMIYINFIQDYLREHVQLLRALQAYLVFLDFLELLEPLVHSIMLAI